MAGNVPHNMKDSRWLQLEVCREAQRNKCTRTAEECKFAHPPAHVEILNGRVVACYDSIKGRCSRDNPPCKYYHPPQHLKDQLLINGRNHLAMKNILVQQMQMQSPLTPQLLQMQSQLPIMNPYYAIQGASPYLNANPSFIASSSSPGPSGSSSSDVANVAAMSPMVMQQQQGGSQVANKNRMDRLEVCREFARGACRRTELECRYAHPAEHVQVTDNAVVVCMDSLKGKCGRENCRYFHPPAHLVQQLKSRQSVNAPVFHGLQASVKRQTMSPSALSNPSLAYYQQQQQQSLQQHHQQSLASMYGLTPQLLAQFQQNLSMHAAHYPSLSPGYHLPGQSYDFQPGGSSSAVEVQEVNAPEQSDGPPLPEHPSPDEP